MIGFWFKRDAAIFANMKAFLVNRIGDLGFLLGIAAILYVFGSLDYAAVFASAPFVKEATVISPFGEWQWMTVICLLLFMGAMGKSAQVPLHVWLPDSMEGANANFCIDPRRDHGDRRDFYGGENVAAV